MSAAHNYYSSFYAQAPFNGTTIWLPRSITEERQGGPVCFRLAITPGAALVNTDVIHLIPLVTAGSYLHDLTIKNDDLDSGATVTFGLGWTSAPTTYLSASTLFQSANTGTALTAAQLMAGAASQAGDELIITLSADSTTAGTITVLGTLFVP